jgi:hypothetical protein
MAQDGEKSPRVPKMSDFLNVGERMRDPASRDLPQAELTAEDLIVSDRRSVEML